MAESAVHRWPSRAPPTLLHLKCQHGEINKNKKKWGHFLCNLPTFLYLNDRLWSRAPISQLCCLKHKCLSVPCRVWLGLVQPLARRFLSRNAGVLDTSFIRHGELTGSTFYPATIQFCLHHPDPCGENLRAGSVIVKVLFGCASYQVTTVGSFLPKSQLAPSKTGNDVITARACSL